MTGQEFVVIEHIALFPPSALDCCRHGSLSGARQQLGPITTRTIFRQLEVLAKHLPTVEHFEVSCELLSQLSCPQGGSGLHMAALGYFLHTLVHGWADDDCSMAATIIFCLFDSGLLVTELLAPDYRLESRPEKEML